MNNLLVGIVVALLASPAAAQAEVIGEARVEWRHGPQDKVIVDERIWRCHEDTCRGPLVDHTNRKRRACRLLARAGRVISFSTPRESSASAISRGAMGGVERHAAQVSACGGARESRSRAVHAAACA